ncbi:unnamed protein product [Sphagnum balticum]
MKSAVNSSRKSELPALTSLRFVAAVAVLASHLSEAFDVGVAALKDLALWQGVSCFFVLSGFILAYVHPKLDGEAEKEKFMVARIARIWPTHVAALIFFIVICPITLAMPYAFAAVVLNLTMTHAWTLYRPMYTAFNTPSWSLSVEFFFYLCFPFLIDRIRATWKWKLFGAICLSLSCVALTMWSFSPFFPAYGSSIPPLINVNPLCRLFEFVVGIVAYLAFDRFYDRLRISKWQATILEVLALTATAVSLTLPRWWVLDDSQRHFEAIRSWFSCGGTAPIFALLVFLMAAQKGVISQLMSLKPLVHCGQLSYSMYLYHYGILLYVSSQPFLMNSLPRWTLICLSVALIFVASEINLNLVEKPFRKWILRIASRRDSPRGQLIS